MGGSAPSAPPAPDPKETIAAQSAADKEAIAAQAQYNRINEVTPTGSLTYTGTPGQADYTRVTSLTPDQQKLLDLQENAGIGAYDLANQELGRVSETLGKGFPVDLPNVRTLDESALPQRIKGQSAEDIADMQNKVSDQAYQDFVRRNQRDWDTARNTENQSLADRGIAEGSDLYNREKDRTEREIADAKQAGAYGAFQLGQDYGLQQSNYTNQQRDSSLAEQLNMQQREQDLRNASLTEQKTIRDVPLSDIATLLGYGSPQAPNVSSLQPININPVPAADIINSNYANQVAAYNAQLQNRGGGLFNTLIGAGATLGGAAIGKYSDIRLKKNIVPRGARNGHRIYEFSYLGSPARWLGVMAQDVMKYMPQAVMRMANGFLAVDYSQLGFDMERAR